MAIMSNDENPGYLGRDLIAGASAAVDRAPGLAEEIKPVIQRLAARTEGSEEVDGLDPDVQTLIRLIERAGVPSPPLYPRRPPERA